jgi:hypothetical protein
MNAIIKYFYVKNVSQINGVIGATRATGGSALFVRYLEI